ncbi:MAG: Cna B-type domain-containing protein [Solobacterium sp.]|nr:Cna B-type domain-containing protein [Solobacterium sp.]
MKEKTMLRKIFPIFLSLFIGVATITPERIIANEANEESEVTETITNTSETQSVTEEILDEEIKEEVSTTEEVELVEENPNDVKPSSTEESLEPVEDETTESLNHVLENNEDVVVESAKEPEVMENSLFAATSGEQDWLHYSIDLEWDIADPSQKYNQKVITASSAILQPKYRLTIQTSSVNYAEESMEIRLPYTMFTKRATSINRDGSTKVYNPTTVMPSDISAPQYPETSPNYFFSYWVDEENDELVFINTKYIPAGENTTVEVMYDVNPNVIIDLDTASFQAKAKATPEAEQAGTYEEEERVSPTITYQLDVGLESITGVTDCTKGTGFEPVTIKDGYRYYLATILYYVRGNSPYFEEFTFDFAGTNGEIVGPVENFESGTTMTLEEAKAYYAIESFINDGGSNREGDTSDEMQWQSGYKVYVRYPDSDEVEEDVMYVTSDVTAYDDDTHEEPEDYNDRLSRSTRYHYTWPKYPDKPRGIWYKNPVGQNRDRVEFVSTRPQYVTSSTDSYRGPARFFIGVEDDHVIFSHNGNGNQLVITDTGLEQERVIDRTGETEPSGAPYLEYEVCGVYLPVLANGKLRIYNEETQSIDAFDGEWFESIVIEGSTDGSTWEEVYTVAHDNPHDPLIIGGTNTTPYSADVTAMWVGKGYRQFRVTFNGVIENIVIDKDIVCAYMHGTDDTSDYFLRQELDQYTNWANIELYNTTGSKEYTVRDWGMITLFPLTEYGSSSAQKFTGSVTNDPVNEMAHVEFSLRTTYIYSLIEGNLGDNPSADAAGKIMYDLRQAHPHIFEELKDLDDVKTLVGYDLLPEGYVFEKFIGNMSYTDSIKRRGTEARVNLGYADYITPTITTINNYKNTRRQMVVFTWDIENIIKTRALNKGVSPTRLVLESSYLAQISWNDLVFYQNEHNLYGEQRGDGKEVMGGSVDNGSPVDTWINYGVFREVLDENGEYAYKDLNEDGDSTSANTLYAYSTVSPNVTMSATTGIQKHIMGDSETWTDLDHTDINKEYYYRVRVSNGDNTHVTDLIIYDTLEEAANTQLETGEVTWKGSFKSIDVSSIEAHGFAPVVYYSTADPADLDYNIVTGREDNIWIDDTTLWSSEVPSDPSKVTAVAVDLRKMQDGSDAELGKNQGVEFFITMVAPPEYPTLKDPEMVYAINRPAYHSYQYVSYAADGTYFTDIGRRVKIYLEPVGRITVKKNSVNEPTPADTKFVVTGPNDYKVEFLYSDMVDGVYNIEPLQMGEYTITEYLNGEEYSWDVSFDGAANPSSSYEDGAIVTSGNVTLENAGDSPVVEITNTSYGAKIQIEAEKVWEDANNQDGVRPKEVTVNLLGDGELVTSQKVTEANSWKCTFTDLPKYKEFKEIKYTLEEEPVEGYELVGITEKKQDEELDNDKIEELDNIETKSYIITNKHVPETINLVVKKTWEGDSEDTRPATIVVKLLADKKEIQSKEISVNEQWTYTFVDLPKYKDGKEIVYTIEETKVEGYEEPVVKKDGESGFTITNKYVPTPTPTPSSSPTPKVTPTPTPNVPTKTTVTKVPTPYTGDNFHSVVWIGLLLGAMITMCGSVYFLKKSN